MTRVIVVTRLQEGLAKACVPMHTFGHPVDIDEIAEAGRHWNLVLVEDAAWRVLGSLKDGRHIGNQGAMSVFQF